MQKLQAARREIKGLRSKQIRALRRPLFTFFITAENNNTTGERARCTRSLLAEAVFSISNNNARLARKQGFRERSRFLIKEKPM